MVEGLCDELQISPCVQRAKAMAPSPSQDVERAPYVPDTRPALLKGIPRLSSSP